MKSLDLRSQLIAVAGLVVLYSIGVGTAFRVEARAHARLDRQMRESLTVLSSLPRLRDRLRRVDQATVRYLLTGQRSWLDRREDALGEVRSIERDLAEVAGGDGASLIAQTDRRLTAYLAESGQWVARRRFGRLSPADAARAGRLGHRLDSAAEPLARLGEANIAQLRERGAELERASRLTAWLIVLAGALAAVFIAWFLKRFLVAPVSELRERAKGWTLGRAWNDSTPAAAPEVADLFSAMREMTLRLNEQFAREAELGRLKGNLVSMASHEFNNALSVLGGASDLLKTSEPGPLSGKRADYYAAIESNVRSLALATRNLLDLGRLENGRFAVRPRRADIGRVLRTAAQSLKPLYERKGLEVRLEAEDGLCALADPESLHLVATNLISNAIKYTPEGGCVRAGIEVESEDRLRVFVADNGIGIAPEDRERILHGHRTEAGREAAAGFGVGLTLVRSVLDAHETALSIEGGPGRGSRFSFALPRWKEDESAARAPQPL